MPNGDRLYRRATLSRDKHDADEGKISIFATAEKEWEAFRSTFENAYPAYFTPVQGKLPGLSAAELQVYGA